MTPDDVRLTAQLVVDRRVHCVSDAAVMALARRVLELERWAALAAQEAIDVEAAAWESAAQAAETFWEFGSHATDIARTIRARGAK